MYDGMYNRAGLAESTRNVPLNATTPNHTTVHPGITPFIHIL